MGCRSAGSHLENRDGTWGKSTSPSSGKWPLRPPTQIGPFLTSTRKIKNYKPYSEKKLAYTILKDLTYLQNKLMRNCLFVGFNGFFSDESHLI